MSNNPTDIAACAVCPKPIRPGLLMCAAHWRLVPHELQQTVYRRWGRVENGGGAGGAQRMKAVNAYREARDAAIASVNSTLPITTTGVTP